MNLFLSRKKYKKELAFKKKVNAMKGWTIKSLDEVIQDYLIEMESIPENPDDIGALDEILFEDEQPQNSLIWIFITALKRWFQQKLSTLHYFSSHYVTQFPWSFRPL